MEFVSAVNFARRVAAGRLSRWQLARLELPDLVLQSRGTRPVNALQLVEMLAVHFRVCTKEVEVCAERLPFTLRFRFLLGYLVALTLVNMKDLYLQVLGPARHIGEHSRPLAQLTNHVAANVAGKDRARERVLEQDLDHLL